MKEVIVFTDTNVFIQLRDLQDLPWCELFPDVKHVAIMVARPVIQELGRHKVSTKPRLRNRARAALKIIDEASAAPNRMIELQKVPILVTLMVPQRIKPDWASLPNLEQCDPDDQLVAAAFTYANDSVLLSHDSGPRISARDVGLVAYDPPQGWLLTLEQSDDQRRIRKLEHDLDQALSRSPQMSISFPQAENGKPITLYHYKLPQLPKNIIDVLAYGYISAHPKEYIETKAYPFGSLMGSFPGFTPEDQAHYGREYSKFTDHVHEYFAKLHKQLTAVVGVPELMFTISNSGSGSALNLVVSIKVDGDFGLVTCHDRSDIARRLSLPEVPRPRIAALNMEVASMDNLLRPPMPTLQPPDPTEMRWYERPKSGEAFESYGCKDFRPGRSYEDVICLRADPPPSQGTIQVMASAEQMAEVSAKRNVMIKERAMTWPDPIILEMLPKEIREAVAGQTG